MICGELVYLFSIIAMLVIYIVYTVTIKEVKELKEVVANLENNVYDLKVRVAKNNVTSERLLAMGNNKKNEVKHYD